MGLQPPVLVAMAKCRLTVALSSPPQKAHDHAAGELDLREHTLAEAERVAEVCGVFVGQLRF